MLPDPQAHVDPSTLQVVKPESESTTLKAASGFKWSGVAASVLAVLLYAQANIEAIRPLIPERYHVILGLILGAGIAAFGGGALFGNLRKRTFGAIAGTGAARAAQVVASDYQGEPPVETGRMSP